MGNWWTPDFDSSSTSPSSTRPSSPGIAQNTSNEGTHSGSTRLDEDFPNQQIHTPPNLTSTFAELETAIRNFWREREMGDSWIPHFDSSSTSPSSTRPLSLGIAQNTSNEGTHSGSSSTRPLSLGIAQNTSNVGTHSGSTRLGKQILTPPNLTFTFAELETAIRNFWREREMGDSWIRHFDSSSTSPSSTRPLTLGIAQNTSNEGTHLGIGSALSTRLDEDFPNGQILTTPNLTFTSAELETATRNFRPHTVIGRGRGLKQKLVVEVDMHGAKRWSKAMKIAVGSPGVISATLVPYMNQLKVVGHGVDPVNLTMQLRKRMSSKLERLLCASMVSIELVSVSLCT